MSWKRVLGSVVVTIPVAVTFFDCVGYVAKVEGASMQPSLNPEYNKKVVTDYVLLNRWIIKNNDVERGDIVSVLSPRDPDQKLIKRIIAVEGDLVKSLTYKSSLVRIPNGHCWIEGDHSKASMDSNYFGPVSVGLIHAKASHIVWPPSRWQKLATEVPKNRNALVKEMPSLLKDNPDLDLDEISVGIS